MFAMDKHVSLFNRNISDEEEKGFYSNDTCNSTKYETHSKKTKTWLKIEKKMFSLFSICSCSVHCQRFSPQAQMR
jgi:hypothetical protein